jgi:hypothetical protein
MTTNSGSLLHRCSRGRGEPETARPSSSNKTNLCPVFQKPPQAPPTVAEVLGRYWRASKATIAEETQLNRITTRIPRCRTGRLGGAAFNCTQCDHATLTMRSCGNRHCPTCNGLKRRQWRGRLIDWSLDCDYLHVVFTLPHEFNDVIAAHQKILYALHFRCVSAVLNETAEKEYGCEIGIVEVLHTWGQRLGSHVHIHNVMTAGGLSHDKKQWIPISADDVAMQREVLAEKFRKTYLRRLKTMITKGKVVWPDADKVLAKVAAKDWVVNVQAPPPKCQGSEAVINYLASYVIGGPISDLRIISDDGKLVTFRFKNHTTDKIEYETIPGEEFVRRYLLHILPRGMARVRYKGLFRTLKRMLRLLECQELITAAGLSRKESDATSAARPIGNEHDEDEMEVIEPSDQARSGKPGCSQCSGEMEGNRENWFSAATTRFMLKAVAAVLVTIDRSGQSVLIQIQKALASRQFKSRWIFSSYQINWLNRCWWNA